MENLKSAGCLTIYAAGSFVTGEEVPNDFDACWGEAGVNPLLLDPVFLIFDPGRAARKSKYPRGVVPGICNSKRRRVLIPGVLPIGGIGLKEQQIQRHEATDYATANLARIKEVVNAFGVDINNTTSPADSW